MKIIPTQMKNFYFGTLGQSPYLKGGPGGKVPQFRKFLSLYNDSPLTLLSDVADRWEAQRPLAAFNASPHPKPRNL